MARRSRRTDRNTGRRGDAGAEARPPEIDRLVHEPVRLLILSALARDGPLTFSELKDRTAVTDGNLSTHARRLEEANYVVCRKCFQERKPRTEYRLTPTGSQALERYLESMDSLISAARSSRNLPKDKR